MTKIITWAIHNYYAALRQPLALGTVTGAFA